ncbi:MAG: ArgE/DapE family deacylase [Deinococcales bacterium]
MSVEDTSGIWQDVDRAIDDAWDAELAFLRDLVRLPSTLGNERQAQQRVQRELTAMGLEPEAHDVDHTAIAALPGYSPVDWVYEGRPNVAARVAGRGPGGRSLVLNGHIDVVPATPERLWSVDPWGAEIVGDRMYGRGAADMKSGIAAMIYALAALRRAGVELAGDVLLQTVIEEECTGNGTLAALAPLAASLAGGERPAAAIIPEPFNQTLLTAQIGVLWSRITVLGAGAHALGADKAVNANEKAAFLMEGIRAMEAAANEPAARHPAYEGVAHPLNYNVGVVRGGDWPSSVPSECTLEVRFSAYPGADLDEAQRRFREELLAYAARDPWLAEHPPEVSFYGFKAAGCVVDDSEPLFEALRSAHRAVMGTEAQPYVSTATTDVRFFSHHHGIPATCYGPVGANLHAPDEWVDLVSVRNVTKVLARATLAWCGLAR